MCSWLSHYFIKRSGRQLSVKCWDGYAVAVKPKDATIIGHLPQMASCFTLPKQLPVKALRTTVSLSDLEDHLSVSGVLEEPAYSTNTTLVSYMCKFLLSIVRIIIRYKVNFAS